ncbi:hypothetical protein IT40_07365 [Paracoccus versutus]|nr:hypothetical protein IT40_07365 [Paracoccus versutus]
MIDDQLTVIPPQHSGPIPMRKLVIAILKPAVISMDLGLTQPHEAVVLDYQIAMAVHMPIMGCRNTSGFKHIGDPHREFVFTSVLL